MKDKIENYTVSDFINKGYGLEYDCVLKHLKPRNKFASKEANIDALKYNEVRVLIKLVNEIDSWDDVCELFCLAFQIEKYDFLNETIQNFYGARNFLFKEIEKIVSRENKLLNDRSVDSELWQNADNGRLKPFSDILPLITLGEKFRIYPFDLGSKPYGEILSLLLAIKKYNEVERDFYEIKKGMQ